MKKQSQLCLHTPVKAVFQFITLHCHQSISLSDVAKAVGYSPAYLTDLVRHETGRTVNQWISEYRLTRASWLLLETNQTVSQIAKTVGYQHIGYFFRQFRRRYGMTPKNWRESQRGPGQSMIVQLRI
jgi:AraC-like DNA-binding protein